MSKDLSAKYYRDTKGRPQKKKIVRVIKIFRNMKNKSWCSREKYIII